MSEWKKCQRILCVRLDNRGDVLMTSPAIRALKESFDCNISLMTSSMAADIVSFLPEIDQLIVFDAPWVRSNKLTEADKCNEIIQTLKQQQFDAAVIFSVFSQNPLPSAMLLYLAGIPKRLAYCRENPYGLLTDWLPDAEPYEFIQHQVMRDIRLVESIGAKATDKRIRLRLSKDLLTEVTKKLKVNSVDITRPWMIIHAGVSEPKRKYPLLLWIEAGKKIVKELDYQVLLTGGMNEKPMIEMIKTGIGENAFNIAGVFSLEEFITLVKLSPLVISVNTVTMHIAAATHTPVIVLYALTNPQHMPWMAFGKILPFTVPEEERSKNEILRYVHKHFFPIDTLQVTPEEIVESARNIIEGNNSAIPDMLSFDIMQKFF